MTLEELELNGVPCAIRDKNALHFDTEDPLDEEEKARVRNAIGAAPKTYESDEKYFDIDYDGIVSLKEKYRGHPANDTYDYAVSDNGVGVDGSCINELPEKLVIPDVINGTAVSGFQPGMFLSNERVKSVTIPSYISAIPLKFADQAHNLFELKGIENVETIAQTAFQACGIKKALFPKLKQFDGVAQFNYCAHLSVVDIGNVVDSIPQNCFCACERLSLILGGASVTSIGQQAFYGTRSLKNLPILENVKSIGNEAFVLSRVNFDWWNNTFSSVGTNGTPAKFNPTEWWSDCTYEACENPLGSTFAQGNPKWANDVIKNSSDTYGNGCVEISTAHIYSALTGVKFDSPRYFVENIVGSIDNGSLFVPTDLEKGEPAYGFNDMANWLTHLGLQCEVLSGGYNSANMQRVYNELKAGALILTGIFPGHAAVLYGVASNGELLTLDSSPYQQYIEVYEAETFQQRISSLATKGQGIVIVKKKGE